MSDKPDPDLKFLSKQPKVEMPPAFFHARIDARLRVAMEAVDAYLNGEMEREEYERRTATLPARWSTVTNPGSGKGLGGQLFGRGRRV